MNALIKTCYLCAEIIEPGAKHRSGQTYTQNPGVVCDYCRAKEEIRARAKKEIANAP